MDGCGDKLQQCNSQGELFAQPGYHGCAFARASAQSHPGDPAEEAAEVYRRWVRALLTELSGRMDHDPAAAAAARAAAATLLDAALAPRDDRPAR